MEYKDINLSSIKNPILIFDNTIGATKEDINTPLTYKDNVIGTVTDVTEENVYCKVFEKFVKFYGVEEFKLFSLNISLLAYEINKQNETENYVAIEMYKQFMKDNMSECAKVRKQILKKQPVDYFKRSI